VLEVILQMLIFELYGKEIECPFHVGLAGTGSEFLLPLPQPPQNPTSYCGKYSSVILT